MGKLNSQGWRRSFVKIPAMEALWYLCPSIFPKYSCIRIGNVTPEIKAAGSTVGRWTADKKNYFKFFS
jgi:hypothetical protein